MLINLQIINNIIINIEKVELGKGLSLSEIKLSKRWGETLVVFIDLLLHLSIPALGRVLLCWSSLHWT